MTITPDNSTISLSAKTSVPEHVLFQEASGSAALLNLDTETYFGLDDVGVAMWKELESAGSIGAAAEALEQVYDAPLPLLQQDLVKLIAALQAHGLITVLA